MLLVVHIKITCKMELTQTHKNAILLVAKYRYPGTGTTIDKEKIATIAP